MNILLKNYLHFNSISVCLFISIIAVSGIDLISILIFSSLILFNIGEGEEIISVVDEIFSFLSFGTENNKFSLSFFSSFLNPNIGSVVKDDL